MDYNIFEKAALIYVDKFKEIIDNLPSLEQKKTYMNFSSDIPIQDFYLFAGQIRQNNNIEESEEYESKIKSLLEDIISELFAYCRNLE